MNKLKYIFLFIFLSPSFTVNAQLNTSIIYEVNVYDSTTLKPINNARISLKKGEKDLETEISNSSGSAKFSVPAEGDYTVNIYGSGFNEKEVSIKVSSESPVSSIFLQKTEYKTEEIEIIGERETSQTEISTITGAQVLNADVIHIAPTARMSDVIQDNLTGAVHAPNGEVHIRGEHGEFSYVIDGMPVSLGIFGGLNEIVDPQVIDKIKFITGGFSSEYGGQMSAIIDLQNRVPPGKFHLDFSSYIGSYLVFNGSSPFHKGNDVPIGHSSNAPGDTLGGDVGPLRTLNSNGQSLSFSGHTNKLGYFISTSRQETDRRIDQPVPTLFNDKGTDYSAYGKIDYVFSENDFLTTNFNYGKTNTQVPFNITTQGYSPDNEIGSNSFQAVSYTHLFSSKDQHQRKLFIGLIGRQGTLTYTPSILSPVNFAFSGDSTLYALSADRKFSSYGIKSKYDITFSKIFSGFTGFDYTATSGSSYFTSRDNLGRNGPSEYNPYKGSDFGAYLSSQLKQGKHFILEAGLRYDQHIAPDAGVSFQFSPRVKLSFMIDGNTSSYLYYGRLFIPTNIEAIRAIASNVVQNGSATLPEKSNFYEAVFIHEFQFGLSTKTSFYYKYSSPGLDDQTIGSSALKTPVNIQVVKTTGLELALTYQHPKIPLSAYLNSALCHAFGSGLVTGGFLPINNDGTATDLDHDQRLTITGGINFHPKQWFIELTGNYSSGLTNGNPDNTPYKTGLFDFNSNTHVQPWENFNLGVGYTFNFKGDINIEPSLYINNIFDKAYLEKGAYFSGASYGERRNVVIKLNLHL